MPEDNTELLRKLEKLFSYHPFNSDAEQELHIVVNEASLAYVKRLAGVIKNPAELTTILREIQKVRMLANAAVCYERVGISYRDLFPPTTSERDKD
jgi:predicted NAD/FAD-binding protein